MEEVQGVVVAVYKQRGGYPRFAVLRREQNWEGWELIKGRIDEGEEPDEAARREVEEETGITPEELTALDGTHEWEYERDGTEYHAIYHPFIARVPGDSLIDVDSNHVDEHSKGHFLNVRDATDILTHENQRDLVERAVEYIEDHHE